MVYFVCHKYYCKLSCELVAKQNYIKDIQKRESNTMSFKYVSFYSSNA